MDLLGNRNLLQQVQKGMVCDLRLVHFDPFCEFLCFMVHFFRLTTCERCNKYCKLAFKVQGLRVIEKLSNGKIHGV